ncbi:MAG: type I-E CRISPR-associated protein Cse2/CasB [Geminicoccaceae bacterium]|nr:type I-E CRISPR-associated protein Cse2/CasB [Geminicoccaceae bacterium]
MSETTTATPAGEGRVRTSPALEWWQRLQPDAGRPGDRAALARLRRAVSLAEAMSEPAVLQLFRRLGYGAGDRVRLPRVALVAVTLAHVRTHEPTTVMRRVGRAVLEDETATLKPIRLRQILAARSDEELAVAMRRLVMLADRRLDVADLARSILFWNDETRARWAFDYFNAGSAAPNQPDPHGAEA